MGDPLLITTTIDTVLEPEVSMLGPEVSMLGPEVSIMEPDVNSSHYAQVSGTV